jgi:hypothetical protein
MLSSPYERIESMNLDHLPVPQTDSHHFRSAWGDERNFVLEASQFPQHGNNLLVKCAGKNSPALLGFRCMKTWRANMLTSLDLIEEVRFQIT